MKLKLAVLLALAAAFCSFGFSGTALAVVDNCNVVAYAPTWQPPLIHNYQETTCNTASAWQVEFNDYAYESVNGGLLHVPTFDWYMALPTAPYNPFVYQTWTTSCPTGIYTTWWNRVDYRVQWRDTGWGPWHTVWSNGTPFACY